MISEYLKSFNYNCYLSKNKSISDFNSDYFDLIHIRSGGKTSEFYQALIESSSITEWILVSNYLESSSLYHELNQFIRNFNTNLIIFILN